MTELAESTTAATPAEARSALKRAAELVRQGGVAHAAMHDLLLLWSNTETLFSLTKYEQVASSEVQLNEDELSSAQVRIYGY